MKKLVLALSLPVLAFLGSCGGDSANPEPSISLNAGAGLVNADMQIMSDSMLKFSITATAGSESLSKITVTSSKNGAAASTLQDTAVSGKTVSYVLSRRIAGSVDDKIVVTFTATDANGKTKATSVTISVVPAMVLLTETQLQKVWNTLNQAYGNAYDLETGAEIMYNDPNPKKKDLLDMTVAGDAQFSKSWGSGNGTKFIKLTTGDYTNASSTTYLYNIWKNNSASAVTKVTNLAINDVYLVKTGQDLPFNLYIIKVTDLIDNPAAGNHNDYVEFSYKKIDN